MNYLHYREQTNNINRDSYTHKLDKETYETYETRDSTSTEIIDTKKQELLDYLDNWENLEVKLVYYYKNSGGLGDYLKYFGSLLNLCMKKNYKLYFYKDDDNDEEFIKKYVYLNYEFMIIDRETVEKNKTRQINKWKKLKTLKRKKIMNLVTPLPFYGAPFKSLCYERLSTMFSISDTVKNHEIVKHYSNFDYISLHIRLGDKHMEHPPIVNSRDDRHYKENLVIEFLERNKDKNILLFCDNAKYKQELQQKYKNVSITSAKVVHYNEKGTTEEEVLHTVIEFYLLSKSKKIYSSCNSGFSGMASIYGNVPYILIDDTLEHKDYLDMDMCVV
jgi:hypothetical protein